MGKQAPTPLHLARATLAFLLTLLLTITACAPRTTTADTYRGEEHGFAVRYPPDVEPGLTCPTEAIIDEPLVTFRLTGTRHYSGTNLLDACAAIHVDDSPAARETCLDVRDDHEDLLDEEEIARSPCSATQSLKGE